MRTFQLNRVLKYEQVYQMEQRANGTWGQSAFISVALKDFWDFAKVSGVLKASVLDEYCFVEVTDDLEFVRFL